MKIDKYKDANSVHRAYASYLAANFPDTDVSPETVALVQRAYNDFRASAGYTEARSMLSNSAQRRADEAAARRDAKRAAKAAKLRAELAALEAPVIEQAVAPDVEPELSATEPLNEPDVLGETGDIDWDDDRF